MFFDMKKIKSWMSVLLCVSMIVGNMAPAFSYGTILEDEIAKVGEAKDETLNGIQEDIKDVLDNGLDPSDELYFSMYEEVKEEIIITKKNKDTDTSSEEKVEEADKKDGDLSIDKVDDVTADENDAVDGTTIDDGDTVDDDIEDDDENAPIKNDDTPVEDENIDAPVSEEIDAPQVQDDEINNPYEEAYEEEKEEDEEEVPALTAGDPDTTSIDEATESEAEETEEEETTSEEYIEELEEEATPSIIDEEEIVDEEATSSEIEEIEDEEATPSEIEEIEEEIATESEVEAIATESEIEENIATDSEVEEIATASEIEEVSTPSLSRREVASIAEIEMPITMLGAGGTSVFERDWWTSFTEVGDTAAWQNIKNIEIHDSTTSVALANTTANGQFEYEITGGDTLVIRVRGDNLRVEGYHLFNNRVAEANGKFSSVERIGFYDENYEKPTKIDFVGVTSRDFSYMFIDCKKLITIENLVEVLPTNIENMYSMFYGCESLIYVDFIGINTSNVSNMSDMFSGCKSLKKLDLRDFTFDSLTDVSNMFQICNNLEMIIISDGITQISDKEPSLSVFSGCTKLKGSAGTVYSLSHTNGDYAHIDGGVSNPGYFWSVEQYNNRPAILKNGWWKSFAAVGDTTAWQNIKNIEIHDSTTSTPLAYHTNDDDFEYEVVGDTLVIKSLLNKLRIEGYRLFDNNAISPGAIKKLQNVEKISFYGENYDEPTKIDLDGVENKDFYYMFCTCDNLATVTNLEKVMPHDITSVRSMFAYCKKLKNIDLSNIDLSNVINMSWMFDNCFELETVVFGGINISHLEDMSYMFHYCKKLKNIDINSLNFENVSNCANMFDLCMELESIDISNLDFSSLTNVGAMFKDCSSLKTIIASTNNTIKQRVSDGQITNHYDMFAGCTSLVGSAGTEYSDAHKDGIYACIDGEPDPGYFSIVYDVPITDYILTTGWYAPTLALVATSALTKVVIKKGLPKVADYDGEYYEKFTIPDSNGLICVVSKNTVDTAKDKIAYIYAPYLDKTVYSAYKIYTEAKDLFRGFANITAVEGLTNVDMTSCTDFSHMYDGCEKITKIYVGTASGATDIEGIFAGCTSVENIAFADGFNTSAVTSMKDLFKGLSVLTTLNIPFEEGFDTSNVNDMMSLFDGCLNLTTISPNNLYGIDTSNVATMSFMFYACEKLSTIDLTTFDTSSAKTMRAMFCGCKEVTSLALDGFDTSDVKDMVCMFADCHALSELDVRSFDTSSVEDMTEMFYECTSLNTIHIDDSFDTSNVKNMYAMFYKCRLVSGIDLSHFDTRKVEDMSYMFDEALTGYTGTEFDLSNFRYDNCISVEYMFFKTFNSEYLVDLKLATIYHASKIENMDSMFANAKIKSVNLEGLDTSHATDMSGMFMNAIIEVLDIRTMSFDSASNISGMFTGCESLKTIYASTSNPIKTKKDAGTLNTNGMFTTCINLVGENGTKYSVAGVNDGSYACIDGMPTAETKGYFTMKYDEPIGDYILKEGWYQQLGAIVPAKSDVSKVVIKQGLPTSSIEYGGTFKEKYYIPESNGLLCIVGNDNGAYIYAPYMGDAGYEDIKIEAQAKDLFRDFSKITLVDNISYLDMTSCTDFSHMYDGCEKITKIYVGTVTNATNIEYMFNGCEAVTEIKFVDGFKGQVSEGSLKGLFKGLKNLETLDIKWGIEHIDTTNVNTTESMYESCEKLTSIELDGLNTSDVATMSSMFKGCKILTSLDLSGIDTTNVVDMNHMFAECETLDSITFGSQFDTSKVENMSYMFYKCRLASGIDLRHFDTRKVEDMSYMFDEALTGYTGTEFDLSNFRYDNCISVERMFFRAFKVENPVELKLATIYHAGKIENMEMMFANAHINKVNIDGLDTSHTAYMACMFQNTQIEVLDIRKMRFDSVTDMVGMFGESVSLVTIYASTSNPIKARIDAGGVEAREMFRSCNSLVGENGTAFDSNHIDGDYAVIDGMPTAETKGYFTMVYDKPTEDYKLATGWYQPTQVDSATVSQLTKVSIHKGTPKYSDYGGSYTEKFVIPDSNGLICVVGSDKGAYVYAPYLDETGYEDFVIETQAKELFKGFTNITAVDGLSNVDVTTCTDFSYMFDRCSNIINIDLSTFAASASNIDYMFKDCSSVQEITFGNNFNTTNVTNMKELFLYLFDLTTLTIPFSTSAFDTSNVTTMESMFYFCTSLKNVNGIDVIDMRGMDTSQVATMSYMFAYCMEALSIDVSDFVTSNAKTMYGMFAACTGVSNLDINNFDTSNVEDMSDMFFGCTSLSALDINNFNTSNVIDMGLMFMGCQSLESLALGAGFDTSKVENMKAMFNVCPMLTGLDLSYFDTHNVKDMSYMFAEAFTLADYTSFDISNFSFENCVDTSLMFDSAFNPSQPVDLKIANVYRPSNIVNMSCMFFDANVNTVEMSLLDTSKVASMSEMFARSKVSSIDISRWSFDSIKDVSYMFKDCQNLTTIYASTSNILKEKCEAGTIDTTDMFVGCSLLKGENGTKATDEGALLDGHYACIDGMPTAETKGYFTMKYDAPTGDYMLKEGWYQQLGINVPTKSNIQKVVIKQGNPVSSEYGDTFKEKYFIPDSNGLICIVGSNDGAYIYAPYMGDVGYEDIKIKTEAKNLFNGFRNIEAVDGIDNLDTSMCTNFSRMFYSCMKIANIDLSSLEAAVSSMSEMFKGCDSVVEIKFGAGFNTTGVTNMDGLFSVLSSLTKLTIPFGASSFDTSNVTSMKQMFYKSTSLVNVNGENIVNLSGMDTSNVVNMSEMFRRCCKMTHINVSTFDTSKVENMNYMFGMCEKLEEINLDNFVTSNVKDMAFMFNGCSSITSLNVSSFDTSNVTQMKDMFNGCSKLDTITFGDDFKTHNVENMSYMFSDTPLASGLDLRGFDTTKVQDMSSMFMRALTAYEGDNFDISSFRYDNCTTTRNMFNDAFKSGKEVNLKLATVYHASSITDMAYMFEGAKIKSVNLEGLDTSHAETMLYMFRKSKIENIDIRNMSFDSIIAITWIDIEDGPIDDYGTHGLFNGCTQLTTIIASTNNAIKTKFPDTVMFDGCTNLVGENGTRYSVAGVKTGSYGCIDGMPSASDKGYFTMVYDKPTEDYKLATGWYAPTLAGVVTQGNLTKVIIKKGIPKYSDYGSNYSEKFVIPNSNGLICVVNEKSATEKNAYIYAPYLDEVEYSTYVIDTQAKDLFRDFTNITTVDNISYLSVRHSTDFTHMFDGCKKIIDIDLSSFVASASNLDDMFYGCEDVETITFGSAFNTTNVTSMKGLFSWLSNLVSLNIPFSTSSFDTSHVTTMESMFFGCSALKNVNGDNIINLVGMNTSQVATMSDMFHACGAAKKIDLSTFDTGNVKTMDSMFYHCISLDEITALSSLDTSDVTDMSDMFSGCEVISAINLSGFDTSNVKDMSGMFAYCSSLNTLTLSDDFKTGNVTDMRQMFQECPLSDGLDLSSFDTSNVKYMNDMFTKALTSYTGDDFDISNFRYDSCLNTSYMFNDAFKSGKEVNLKLATVYHTSSIVDMSAMFMGANIKSINLEGLDTSHAEKMFYMFSGSKIKNIDIRNMSFDSIAYGYWYSIVDGDINDMGVRGLFNNCTQLTTIIASTNNAIKTNFPDVIMFSGCTDKLVGDNGTKWSSAHVNGDYGCIDGMPSSSDKGYFTMVYDKPAEDYKLATGWYSPMLAGVVAKENLTKVIVKKGIPKYSDYGSNYSEKFVIPNSNGLICVVNEKSATEKNAYIYAPYLDTAPYSTTYDINAECKQLFEGFADMASYEGFANLDASGCTDFSHMFDGCTKIIDINLTGLKPTGATNIEYMFKSCNAVKTITFPDDFMGTLSATSMRELFKGLSQLTTLTMKWGSGYIDTSNVEDMESMFDGCTALSKVNSTTDGTFDMTGMNTAKVASMSYMFKGCENAKIINVSNFEADELKNMAHMFDGCKKVTSINLNENLDTSKVTIMEYMFNDCLVLNNLKINYKTTQLLDTKYMFNNCQALNSLTLGSDFKCENVTNMENMFQYCPLSGGLDLSHLETGKVVNMNRMFQRAFTSYNGKIDLSKFMFTQCTSMDSMFWNACGAGSYIVFNPDYHQSALTNMRVAFADCKAKSIDLGGLDTSHVTNMEKTFCNLHNVEILDISKLDFSSVTNIWMMFNGSAKLKTIIASTNNTIYNRKQNGQISNYDGSMHMTDDKMFNECTALVGQNGYKYSEHTSSTEADFARVDGWPYAGATGYFTMVYEEPTGDYHLATDWYQPDDTSVLPIAAPVKGNIKKVVIKQGEPNYIDYYDDAIKTGNYYDKFYIPNSDHLVCVVSKHSTDTSKDGIAYIYAPYLNKTGYTEKIVTECKDLFRDFEHMASYEGFSYLFANDCTDFSHMFDRCMAITDINLTGLKPTSATNIEYMFIGCNAVKTITFPNDFKGTLSATSMRELFKGLSKLETLNMKWGSSYIDTSEVTDMGSLFDGCIALEHVNGNNIVNMDGMNTQNVATMSCMFQNCNAATNINVSGFNTSKVKTMERMFRYCKGVSTFDVDNFTADELTTTERMFEFCINVTSINLNPNLNTSKVTTMEYMFSDCYILDNLNINYDTTGLLSTKGMFYLCRALNNITLGSNFKCQNVTNMFTMFQECPLSQGLDLSHLETGNVETMACMFQQAFTSYSGKIDLSNFVFTKCTSLASTFWSAANANCYIVFNPDRHSSVITDMGLTFADCKVKSIDFGGLDTSHVTNMEKTFCNMHNIEQLDISMLDFSSIKIVKAMYEGSEKLKTIIASTNNTIYNRKGVSGFDSTNMFNGCNALVGQNGYKYSDHTGSKDANFARIDGWKDSTKTGYFTMIYDKPDGNYKLETGWYQPDGVPDIVEAAPDKSEIKKVIIKKGEPDYSDYYDDASKTGSYYDKFYIPGSNNLMCVITKSSDPAKDKIAYIYEIYKGTEGYEDTKTIAECKELFDGFNSMTSATGLTELDTSACQDFSKMFNDCHALTDITFHEGFVAESAKDVSYMFASCSAISSLNIDNFDTTNVTDMSGLFKDCENIVNVNLDNLKTSNVVDMSEMFSGCKKWTTINISKYDTAKVETMEAMYKDCEALNNIVYGDGFNTANVTTMREIFSGCKNLTSAGLNITRYNTEKVTDMAYMFDRCESLTTLDLLGFVTREVTDMSYMFNDCSSLIKLDLAAFKTINVVKMAHMFSDCVELKKISVGSGSEAFNTYKVFTAHGVSGADNGEDMFKGCETINTTSAGGDGIVYDPSRVNVTYAVINAGTDFPGYFSGAPECIHIAPNGDEREFASLNAACEYAGTVGGTIKMLQDKEFVIPVVISDNGDYEHGATFLSTHDFTIDCNNRIFTFGETLSTDNPYGYYMFNAYGNIHVDFKNLIINDTGLYSTDNNWTYAFLIGDGSINIENVRTLNPLRRDYFLFVLPEMTNYQVKATIKNCNIETERTLLCQLNYHSKGLPITTIEGGTYKAKNIIELYGVSATEDDINDDDGTFNINNAVLDLNDPNEDFFGINSYYHNSTTKFALNLNNTTTSNAYKKMVTLNDEMKGTITINNSYVNCLENVADISNKANLTVNINSGEIISGDDMFVSNDYSSLTVNIGGGDIKPNENKIVSSVDSNVRISLSGGNYINYSSISEINNSTTSVTTDIWYSGGKYYSTGGKDECYNELKMHLADRYKIVDIEGESGGEYYYRIERIPDPGNGSGGGGFRGGSKNGPAVRVTYTTKTMMDQVFVPYDYIGWEQNINNGDWKAHRIVDDHFEDCKDIIITTVKYVPTIVNGQAVLVTELKTFYFDQEGVMITGWLQTGDGKWYFFENSNLETIGQLVKDTWIFIGGESYKLAKNGVLYVDTVTDDGFYVNEKGQLVMQADIWYALTTLNPILKGLASFGSKLLSVLQMT